MAAFTDEQQAAAKLIADVGSGSAEASAADSANAYQIVMQALQEIWSNRLSRGEETIGLNWFGLEYMSPLPEIVIISMGIALILWYVARSADVSTYDVMKPAPTKSKVQAEETKKAK